MGTIGRCKICGDTIESRGHRHNFVACSCGRSFVDGGDDYSRSGGDVEVLDSNTKYHGKIFHHKKEDDPSAA